MTVLCRHLRLNRLDHCNLPKAMRPSKSLTLQLLLATFAWLCFGQVPTIAFAQTSCLKTYANEDIESLSKTLIPVHLGHPYIKKVPFPVPEDATVFQLGEGMMGGEVYRVRYSDSSTKVFKVYKKIALAYQDAQRLDIIDTALAKAPQTSGDRFLVVKAKAVSSKIHEVTDTRGSALSEILDNPQISSRIKSNLKQKYKACLRDLFQLLQKQHPHVQMDKDGFIDLDPSQENTDLSIFIHYDNVIVTPSLQLVIIDPY